MPMIYDDHQNDYGAVFHYSYVPVIYYYMPVYYVPVYYVPVYYVPIDYTSYDVYSQNFASYDNYSSEFQESYCHDGYNSTQLQ